LDKGCDRAETETAQDLTPLPYKGTADFIDLSIETGGIVVDGINSPDCHYRVPNLRFELRDPFLVRILHVLEVGTLFPQVRPSALDLTILPCVIGCHFFAPRCCAYRTSHAHLRSLRRPMSMRSSIFIFVDPLGGWSCSYRPKNAGNDADETGLDDRRPRPMPPSV
jgi:hypothetical protein